MSASIPSNWILNGKSVLVTTRAIFRNRVLAERFYEIVASFNLKGIHPGTFRMAFGEGRKTDRVYLHRWNRKCSKDQLLIFQKRQIKLSLAV